MLIGHVNLHVEWVRLHFKHDLQNVKDSKIRNYLADKLAAIPIQEFLAGVSVEKVAEETLAEASLPEAAEEIDAAEDG